MRARIAASWLLGWLSVASYAIAQPSIFFEENFNGPLDVSVWRTEILTSGVRWCDSSPGGWYGPGTWVPEGSLCYGVAAYSPYGSSGLSDGLVHLSSTNGRACPYLVSRLPGPVPLFPSAGDFTLKVRLRFDHITPWGTFVEVLQIQNNEPSGTNPPGSMETILLGIAGDFLYSALGGGPEVPVAPLPSPYQFHVVSLDCVGNAFTISVDGVVVYGPVTSTLRPTALFMGNPVLAYWYPTDWTWFSVDYVRVEVPGTVPVDASSWGATKASYR